MGGFVVTQKDHKIEKTLAISHLHAKIFLKFLFIKGDHILSFDLILVEDLFVLLESYCLQEVYDFLDGPFLDVLDSEGKFG